MKIEQVLELYEPLRISGDESAERIQGAFRKLHANLQFRSQCAVVSISGGSDSDVMLDMIQVLEPEKNYTDANIHYVWFNTGLEYTLTKEHLRYLEEKYSITIERIRAKAPVPIGCRDYGQPFISKRISQYIGRLQSHGFNFKLWGNESFDFLLRLYPNCKAALRWWCNEWGQDSQINIEKCRLLKEFMIENPPDFPISDGCCKGAKKDVAHDYLRKIGATINMVGIRKAEGGARSTVYNSCFTEPSRRGEAAQFRPIFYLTDQDKEIYCKMREVKHSDLYEKHGFKRTGCACCPFGSRFEQELETAERLDPGLAVAAKKIFASSYEYTRAYRAFKAEHDSDKKADANQTSLWD